MSIKKNYVLGLDISTSTVGAAIIDPETNELKGLFYISLKKEKGLLNKIKLLKNELQKYEGMIGYVAIEEPLVMFKEGFSRAQILSMLSQFNGMSQFLTFLLYNTEPVMYNVSHIRKVSFPTLKFPRGCKRKELVQKECSNIYPDVDWPKKPKANNPDGSPKLKDECYDLADAIAVARCHVKKLQNGDV